MFCFNKHSTREIRGRGGMMEDEKAEEVVEEKKAEAEEEEEEEKEVKAEEDEEEAEAEEEKEVLVVVEKEEKEVVVVVEKEEEEEDDLEKLETEKAVLCFIKKIINKPAIKADIPSNYNGTDTKVWMEKNLKIIERFITMQHADNALDVMEKMMSLACRAKDFTKAENNKRNYMSSDWEAFLSLLDVTVTEFKRVENDRENKMRFTEKLKNSITKSSQDVKNLEESLLDKEDSSPSIPLNLEEPAHLLMIKAFPSLARQKESPDMENLIVEQCYGLWSVALRIYGKCEKHSQSLAVLLIGSLLSFRRPDNDTWENLLRDLEEEDFNGIFHYCIKDLLPPLQQCYLYLACYPMGYEIPTESITKIWIAEGFITLKEGETREETAYKYLEELVQRSLIWVSMRSLSGTIKYFRVCRTIRDCLVDLAMRDLIVNPEVADEMGSFERVAINKDDKYQYTKVTSYCMRSFLAFDTDRNVLRSARFLRVLELRNSVVQETFSVKMLKLRYLGLRDSNISELPKYIGNMKDLQTLDVRGTKIKTLPESLWHISTLCHVYVNPRPRIEGPPPTANIPNLQILKSVGVPKSWKENVPCLSINLRKLALSYTGHLELETLFHPLSRMVNLLSIAIMGPVIHAELVDTRALPNMETLKSIEFVGIWKFRKLSIDNVEFPSNLTKLILSNSHLKEDPMPRLERLQALKLLRLEDGAYMGDKMVCSAKGFPQLQILKLSQLENLKIWEVKPMAMSKLTKLRVVKCLELKINLPDFEHVKDIVIDNFSLVPYVHV